MLRALESGKQKDARDSLLRVSATKNSVTMNANDVEAGCTAQVTEEGVAFFEYHQFLPLIRTYPYVKTLTIEVTPEGIQIGNTKISRGFWEISLFANPLTAPKHLGKGARAIRRKRVSRPASQKSKTSEVVDFVVVALDAAERTLAKLINEEQVQNNKPTYASNAKDCDLCQRLLVDMGLFVDGNVRGRRSRAIMCAVCFLKGGETIDSNSGQLYARQADDQWRLVAGFPDEDDRDRDLLFR